jgi:hypothetical protein
MLLAPVIKKTSGTAVGSEEPGGTCRNALFQRALFSRVPKADAMAKKQLLDDIKTNPANFYRTPNDVARDRRFSDAEKLEILEAWERDARALSVADEEGMTGGEPSRLKAVVEARREIESRLPGETKYRESSKYGGGSVQ